MHERNSTDRQTDRLRNDSIDTIGEIAVSDVAKKLDKKIRLFKL